MRSVPLVLLCLAAPVAADDTAAKKALDQLQGKWELTEVTEKGRIVDPEKLKKFPLTFDGDQVEMPFDGRKAIKHKVTIRPTGNPREIDFQYPPEAEGGQTLPGIYKIEGGVLTIALGLGKDAKRPEKFESTGPPNASVLMVLKKAR